MTPGQRKWGGTVGVLVLAFAAATVFGQFRGSVYTTSTTIGIYALLALPLGLLYGQGGTVSLAQGAFAAIGGYTSAILSTRYGLPPLLSLVPAVLVPAMLAFVIAKPILRLGQRSDHRSARDVRPAPAHRRPGEPHRSIFPFDQGIEAGGFAVEVIRNRPLDTSLRDRNTQPAKVVTAEVLLDRAGRSGVKEWLVRLECVVEIFR